jgi:BCD family chlorophyll transporter-like MFS transporter
MPGPIYASGGDGRAASGGRVPRHHGLQHAGRLLEPYGGEILGLSVSATTLLTAIWAAGALTGFALAARWLARDQPLPDGRTGISRARRVFGGDLLQPPWGSAELFFVGAGA